MWWESLVTELVGSLLGVASVLGGVAGAAAGLWLASVYTGSATVGVLALFVGLIGGAKGTRFIVSRGIEHLERWVNRSA